MSSINESLAWLEEFGIEGEVNNGWMKTLCPFHEDTDPSASINLEDQFFKCHACGAKGDIFKFMAAKVGKSKVAVRKLLKLKEAGSDDNTINPDLALKHHRALRGSQKWIRELAGKGITPQTIDDYMLGLDGRRVTIPIYDRQGMIVNIRKYKPNSRDSDKKTISLTGYGQARLYPIASLDSDEVILTEGELKALLLNQIGFTAMSPTGGASTWSEDWNTWFSNKRVVLIYDIDDGGRAGANRVAKNVFPYASEVKIVRLPISRKEYPKGDITDYVVALGHGATDIRRLIDNADPWSPSVFYDEGAVEDEEVHELHLSQASSSKYHGKLVQSEVVIQAKDIAPYIVPLKFEVKCSKDKDICAICPIWNAKDDQAIVEIDSRNPVLLEMLNVHRDKLGKILQRAANIPKQCDVCRFKTTDTTNIEELRLIPQLGISTAETEHVARRAFYVGHGIETNAPYKIQARVVPEPNTQYATMIVYNADAAQDSLSTFGLSETLADDLKVFQPKEWTVEALENKLHEIYTDLEANVTRIYQRRDMHLLIDLTYHSALYIPFQGKRIKGWVESLILGDSGQGKSEATSLLRTHYGLGEKFDCKGATAAGIKGGAQETARRWFITWGVIPLNDRRLVVLEEVKGMPVEVLATLTDMRSSGVAEIVKIERAKTNARCRLLWISNPRSDKQLMSFNFGVEAIKELVGSLEDIRRFDMAMLVASGEVDKKWLNVSDGKRPKAKHVFNKDLCRALILWVWSMQPEQIKLTDDAQDAMLSHASDMGTKYTSQIPLVETADHRLKLLRLSTALAARTYSTDDDGKTLIVRACHVDYIAKFMDRIYSSPVFGYNTYSDLLRGENTVQDEDEIVKQIKDMPYARDLVRSMLESKSITVFDIADLTGQDMERCREFLGLLVRKNALKRGRRAYLKNPAFIGLLKRLQLSDDLGNETMHSKTKDEEF